jgi:hypothetical protein
VLVCQISFLFVAKASKFEENGVYNGGGWFHASSAFQSFDVVEFFLIMLFIYCGLNGINNHVWVLFGYIFTINVFHMKTMSGGRYH